jgi:hypothetical protein
LLGVGSTAARARVGVVGTAMDKNGDGVGVVWDDEETGRMAAEVKELGPWTQAFITSLADSQRLNRQSTGGRVVVACLAPRDRVVH